jgi:hypothetical protein
MKLTNKKHLAIIKNKHFISGTSNKTCVFAPYAGEFGNFIMRYMRFVHFFKCPHKIVCCKKGEEVYYPSANDFHYIEDNVTADADRVGLFVSPRGQAKYQKKCDALISELNSQFKNHEIIHLYQSRKKHGTWANQCHSTPVDLNTIFDLDISKCSSLNVDITIAPRLRLRFQNRNFLHWDKIVQRILDKKLTIGVCGIKESSCILDGVVNAWDLPGDRSIAEKNISLLIGSKLYIGTDTGVSHLAAFLQKPMIIFNDPQEDRKKMTMIKQMKHTNRYPILSIGSDGWNNPDKILDFMDTHVFNRFVFRKQK